MGSGSEGQQGRRCRLWLGHDPSRTEWWGSGPAGPDAALVTVLEGHPATLSWLDAVLGHRVKALGVDRFGQSADLIDLYRVHGLDAGAILDACAAACLAR